MTISGINEGRKRIEEWFTRQMVKPRERRPRCLIVYHVANAGDSRAKLDEIDLGIEGQSPDMIAEQCIQACETDVAQWDMPQSYSVHLYLEGCNDSESRVMVKLRVHKESTDLATEPATPTGLVAQAQRHVEAVMRMTLSSMGEAMRMMGRSVELAEQRAKGADEKRIEFMAMLEGLYTRKEEREVNMLERAASQEMKEKAFERVMLLAPIMAGKFLGDKAAAVTAQSADLTIAATVRGFLSSLDEGQIEKLITSGIFSPDQVAALSSVVQLMPETNPDKDKEK